MENEGSFHIPFSGSSQKLFDTSDILFEMKNELN